MERSHFLGWQKSAAHYLQNIDEDPSIASLPQPKTPSEPLEFLSRSWSLSANEVSKAIAQKQKECTFDNNPNVIPQTVITTQQLSDKVMNPISGRRHGAIGRWFHHKDAGNMSMKKKDKARIENAHTHAALSVAGVAAGLAATLAAENSEDSGSKISVALASATELLACHCIELAESSGADHDRVLSTIRSAIDIHSASDLVTLTAVAATALQAEAALKARFPKESKRNGAITPCDKSMIETPTAVGFHNELMQKDPPFEGELLQQTEKGVRWKHTSVYINKKSQVIMKLKSKNVGGAFSKKNKCVVYEVCDQTETPSFEKEMENPEVYFRVKTAQGHSMV